MVPRGATRTIDGGADPARPGVVEAKLRPPRLREGALERAAVVARLDAAPRHVIVRAPAGFGKTTAVRQWFGRLDRPAAWLSLDRGDDDPVVFFRHFVAALRVVADAPTATVIAARPGGWDPTAAIASVESDLRDAGPFVVVLDDLHEITSDDVLDFGDRLLDALPDGAQVVVVTRGDPGPRRRRRLLDGSVSELDAEDLRLDRAESAALLAAVCPGLDREVAEVTVDRCDGWPAGLVLVGLALTGADDSRAVASGLSLVDRPVAEYLRDEVLSTLADDLRDFMVRTSVLDVLTAPLCDSVLERSGSHEVLEGLVRSGNVFVAGLDDEGTSYRYHQLWRELLLAELRATVPGDESVLRARAAEWFDSEGRPDEAIDQLLAAGEPGRAAAAVTRVLDRYVLGGREATLRRWVAAFPADMVVAEPGLALTAAWVAMLTGADDEFGFWLGRLQEFPADTVLASGVPLVVGAGAVELVSGRGGTKSTIGVADRLVDVGPDRNPWWPTARVVSIVSRLHAGLLDEPDDALRTLERETASSPALRALVRAHRVTVALRNDRAADVLGPADAAVAVLEEEGLGEFGLYAIVFAAHALAHARVGDPAVSRRSIERTLRLAASSITFSPRARSAIHLLVADAFVALDDVDEAADHLRDAEAILADEPDAQWLGEYADELAARLEARSGAAIVEPLSAAELRVLRELPTHWSLGEIAEALFVSRNTVKTQSIAIYRKLGVSSRSGAVARARELGLLAS